MDLLDKVLLEWSARTDKGYPDFNNEQDLALFESMFGFSLNEQEEEKEDTNKLKDELINLIKNADLSSKELKTYLKSITDKGLTGKIRDKLISKGFTADSFKVGDKAVEYIISKITDTEASEFLNYQPKKFSSLPVRGNLLKSTGMSESLFRGLFDIEPGADAGGSSIGKGELFLALAFSDIDNRGGAGDLNFKNQNLEVKGTAGRLGGQGRGGTGASSFYLNNLGERFLENEELDEFINDSKNSNINYAIKDLFEKVKQKNGDTKALINSIVRVLDNLYFNQGKASTYFGNPSDYTDLAKMKNNLLKLNAASYASKTEVGYIIFVNSKNGDYTLISANDLDSSIDSGSISTGKKGPTKNPTLGFKWHDPHPSLVLSN